MRSDMRSVPDVTNPQQVSVMEFWFNQPLRYLWWGNANSKPKRHSRASLSASVVIKSRHRYRSRQVATQTDRDKQWLRDARRLYTQSIKTSEQRRRDERHRLDLPLSSRPAYSSRSRHNLVPATASYPETTEHTTPFSVPRRRQIRQYPVAHISQVKTKLDKRTGEGGEF